MTTPKLNHAVYMDDLSADEAFITAAQFEDATRTVVRTLGDNDKLDIVFAGNGGKTNGSTVILPAQDPTKMMTKKQYSVAQGYANHETLHNKCSDMPLMVRELERLKKAGKKLAMTCANAIEDVRIEKAGRDLYPGIPSQIDSTADLVAKSFMEDYYAKDATIVEDFKRIGPIAITWRGRERLGYGSPYIKKCLDTLTPEMLEQVDKWCDIIDKLPTGASGPGMFDQEVSRDGTKRAFQIAEMIAKEIEDIEEEEDEEEDKGEGDAVEGKNEGGTKMSKGKAGGGKGSSGIAELGKHEPVDPDMESVVSKLLTEGEEKGGHRPITTAMDLLCTRETKSEAVQSRMNRSEGRLLYAKVMSKIGSRTAVMKRKFERALLTAAEADYVTGQRVGRLDIRRKGPAIMTGAENVYRRKQDGKAIDTAVTILVDISGSMNGSKMNLATLVCSALAECLENTPVALEILCFNGGAINDAFPEHIRDAYREAMERCSEIERGGKKSAMISRFHRYEPMNIWEIKSFTDTLRDSRGSLGCMWDMAGGNNPDGDAILYAARRLKEQKAGKHILMVLSDGSPAYGSYGCSHEYTKKCTAYVTSKLGINLVGIGIQDDSVKEYYKNYAVVNDLADLDKAIIDNVARLILGENFKVDNADVSGIADNYRATKRRA